MSYVIEEDKNTITHRFLLSMKKNEEWMVYICKWFFTGFNVFRHHHHHRTEMYKGLCIYTSCTVHIRKKVVVVSKSWMRVSYVHCGLSVLVYQSQFHFITEIFMKRSCRCFYSLYIIFDGGKAFVVVVVVVTLLAVVDTMMLKLYDRMQT